MEWHEIEVDGRHTVKFTDLPYVPLTSPPQSPEALEAFVGKKLGGIIRHGEWAWLARNSVLQIVSLRNGQTVSSYEFCESRGYENCCIKCVEEIFPNNPEVMLLAVVLESFRGPGGGGSYVALYSMELSSVLNSIELSLHITCARFLDARACRRSLLQNFDGCLSVGSEEGVIVLLDLNIQKIALMNNELHEDNFVPCHIVDYSLPLTEIHRNFRQCKQDGIHFGLQMEVIESPCSIQCILPIDLILGLAIGLEDGRLALYDLAELQIFFVALPKPEVMMSALVKMDFLEPPDDPRPCLYIWTLHENGENLHAVLHSLMYEKRFVEEDESLTYFESFQTSSVRLQLPLEATKSVALACQAISTLSSHGEDDSNCLCAISWLSVLEGKNKLLIFDLNQWYKEEMPFVLVYGKQPNFLAGYILNGECTGLHTLLNPNNIAHYNSMQRFEEHFYPNSLSFESSLLHTEGSRRYNWEGAQNRVINLLRSSNAAIFLEPNFYFDEIIRTRLIPQFIELNMNSTFSRNAKYEILLSAALEHNCFSLLRDCAKSWIDGSFMGNFSVTTGLSLSTLTDWIWKRATYIKSRCNDLCKSLFEFGGYPLDNREQKELSFITRQLKLLTDLLSEILAYAKKQIPARVYHDLENKHGSLSMASSYQDILLWLMNIGLLPEASPHNDKINVGNDLIPYPYKELKEFYRKKRSFFAKVNKTLISKKSGSCKLLFIDLFIEHVCKGNVLHEYWLENEGDGLYPPNSLEAVLRVMLVPELDYDNKCAILLYFFLDLNMAIDEEAYKDVVANFIKFPSVFKLSAPLIKTVQAFWNLDHDHYLPAVDEFISPFNKNQCYPQWQVELLIEVLLNQKASNLALRVLESQPSLASPLLKLNTLLANELISEAFHFVRSNNDDTLLETFFTCCLSKRQFGVIRDLALSEREGLILQNILKKSKAPGAESLHFVYLLQKSKYIEAVSYMDELSNKTRSLKNSLQQTSHMDTPNLVLSAFNTTMTPVTQGLTDVYFRIKNKIKKKEVNNKSPVPLSCQLIKQNANSLLGGIYHSSALSAHFATYYWGEMEEQTKQAKHLLNSNNAPFLRRPQIDTNCIDYLAKNNISYPQPYKVTEKRTLVESELLENENGKLEKQNLANKLNPKKKRRLIGQEIVDNLSHFMKINKNSNSLNVTDFTFDTNETNETLDQTKKNSLDLLTRPVLTKSVARGQEPEEVAALVPEIHGILKTNTPEPGGQLQREVVEEEKNLRFRLPSADLSTSQVHIEERKSEDVIKEMDIALKDEKEEFKKKQCYHQTGLPKCRQISRAISEESNKSSVSSSNQSEDNFYSPLSSQNNSILDTSNISRHSFMSGPQPRKPLARLSAERSEKSLTPEQKAKTTESTSLITSSNLGYDTALESGLKSKISPRRSIDRLSSDHSKKIATKEFNITTEFSNAAYVTASETVSKPITLGPSSSKPEITQISSGFGSITSLGTSTGSKINEFLPKGSSSKVGTTPVKTSEVNKSPCPAKLSECSTVLGSLTTFECTNTGSNVFAMPSTLLDKANPNTNPDRPTEEQKRQMLETTLSMSAYDFTILDSTSMQQTKSSLMVTAKDVSFKIESFEVGEYKSSKLGSEDNKKMECEEQKKQLEENREDSEENEKNHLIEIQTPLKSTDQGEESNEYCIVLSSSSSASSSPEQEHEYDIESESEEDEIYNEDFENSEFEENNDSNMSQEDVEDDYAEDSNDEELSIEETDNPSDSENEDVIQLFDDSSSDVRQPQANYYGESDSDDVKLVEEPQLAKENINLNTNSTANKDHGDSVVINEAKKDQFDFQIVSSTIGETFSSKTNQPEENLKELSAADNKLSVNDIKTNENNSTSTTDITMEKKSETKIEASKQEEIIDSENKQEEVKNRTEKDIVSGTKEEQDDVKIVASTKDEENLKQLPATENKPLDNDLQNNENNRTSTTEIKSETNIESSKQEIICSENKQEKVKKNTEKDIANETKGVQDDVEIIASTIDEPVSSQINQPEENLKQIAATENKPSENDLQINENNSTSTTEITTKKKSETNIEASKQEEIMGSENKQEEVKNYTEKDVANETKLEQDDVEIMDEPVSSQINQPVDSSENKPSENDIQVNENKSTSTTEIASTKKSETKTEASKQKEIVNSDQKLEEVQNQAESFKELTETSTLENVTPVTTTLQSSENVESQIYYSEKAQENNNTEGETAITLAMEDSMDASDIKTKKQLENKSLTKEGTSEKSEEKSLEINDDTKKRNENVIEKTEVLNVKEIEDVSTLISTSQKRKTLRGTSVPPMNLEASVNASVSSPRRNTRGISVPPQTIAESEEFSCITPRTRRSVRASSLQPKDKMDGDVDTETPRKDKKTHDSESPDTSSRATRGSSLPPGAVAGKITTRRRSVLLDAINEDSATLDSPSTRTRLRSRLNSMESELDASIVSSTEPKRIRRTSTSNSMTELPLTPKRPRRNSLSSQPESVTPRTLRSRSVLSVQEEDTESIPASPNPAYNKRIGMKRKRSTNEELITGSHEEIDKTSPKSDHSIVSEVPYSTSRRLTRTQLAIMEKSAALSQPLIKETETISAPPIKRSAKSRSSRSSTVQADSDDAESVSSKLSTTSSVTGTKRRTTRKALKEKDDIDDDIASVASSVGSEKQLRPRRSKDKSSPNTTLTVIPEEAPIETKKRRRPSKH